MFAEELAYQGAEVAFLVADDERILGDALALIDVQYEVLPFVHNLPVALAEGAPVALAGTRDNLIEPDGEIYERGSVSEGLDAADTVVEVSVETPPAAHCCLETHGSAVRWEGDAVTVWHSTQSVFGARSSLADALDVPLERVRAICEYVGGGFGSKWGAEAYTLMAALAAQETSRPVRALLDREEEHLVAGFRPASRQRVRLGARRDGTLTLIEHESWVLSGALADGAPVLSGPARDLYACPNVRAVVRPVRANTDSYRAFRAPGYVEGTYALESAMDELARALRLDPLALRLANYAETSPARGIPYTSKGLRRAYEMGAERIGWETREERRLREGPWRRGWGMASQLWGGGGGPPAKAIVKMLPDGTAEVQVGVQDLGTGTKTVLAQVAAEELGLPLEDVRVVIGDTRATPFGPGSGGSVTLASTTPAVRSAARDAMRQVIGLAAQMLNLPEAGEEEFTAEDGAIVYRRDPARRVSTLEVAAKMGNYMIVGQGARGPNPDGKALNTFGAHFAEVDVNVETGQVRVRRVVAAHEVGRIVNPLTAASQVYGGVIMALGYALCEERVLDNRTGVQITANLEDYRVPTIADVPEIDVLFVDEADPEANSVGSKGLGEPPIIPLAAAVANAVADATGVRITALPLVPARVLDALRAAQEGRS